MNFCCAKGLLMLDRAPIASLVSVARRVPGFFRVEEHRMTLASVPCTSARLPVRLRTIFLLTALTLAWNPSHARAQAVYGSVGGVITDSTGGVIPGATVTVTSVDRKTSDTVVTNESGRYVKERLLPGTYEVKAELAGFKSATFSDIKVDVDTQTRLDIKMSIGEVSETVTVSGFSPILKTDRADVATTFDAHQISDLPVLDRNFTKFILLTPGTQQLQWQHAASENPQGSTQTMVNGQHFSGTGYQLGGSLGGPIQKDRIFIFGDYQGTRSNVGGSRLLTVPTEAARRGDLSAYAVNLFDPRSGNPAQRQQFANNVIPAGRLSPQALAVLKLIPPPNRPGTENGTRDNYAASGSEVFDNDTFDVRSDGRVSDQLNMFARYSWADFTRDGPTAFGQGGGQEIVSLGGTSKVRNQSLATGFDRVIGSKTTFDFRFGWFKYKVDVLPFDFGTTPAKDAGIPGLNLDNGFTSGLFGGFVEGNRGLNFGSGLGVNRCNCPLNQDEKQAQFVANVTRLVGDHTVKFGVDVRRAWNLRVPSDRHRSGELHFFAEQTQGPSGGGLGIATFLLGEVGRFDRYISPFTDAGERQWRHFYYAQDTWHANSKLTLNYGLRLDFINPQTVSDVGKGGFILADVSDGQIAIPSPNILVAGVGGIPLNGGIKNRPNWAPRVGAAYQLNEKTVLRAGYGRSYDIGVFGSLFGHTVTQDLPELAVESLNAPSNFESVFNLAQGPPAATFPAVGADGTLRLPNGIFARVLPSEQRPPAVDAYNVTVQRELPPTISVQPGYVGNYRRRVFVGDGPDANPNQASLAGYPNVPRDNRRPFFNQYGWTQDLAVYCNCGTNRYDSLQTKLTKRFSAGYSIYTQYTLQRERQHGGDQFFTTPDLEYAAADWDRKHNFSIATTYELPFMRGNPWLGGWQLGQATIIQSGLPFNVTYRDGGADRDTGPNRPNLVGNPDGPKTQDQWFNAAPIGAANSAFSRPAAGTFGNLPRNALRGPGYWRTDFSLIKRFGWQSRSVELRVEAVNLFNNTNLGNPDSEIGVPGNPNPNAGRITSNANFGQDPMRNFQFAVKYVF